MTVREWFRVLRANQKDTYHETWKLACLIEAFHTPPAEAFDSAYRLGDYALMILPEIWHPARVHREAEELVAQILRRASGLKTWEEMCHEEKLAQVRRMLD